MTQTNSKAIRRLTKEYKKLKKYSLPNAEAKPTDDMLNWTAKIKCPVGSIYADSKFKIKITFSERYPMKAPTLQFEPAIDHPAIQSSDGTVCSEVLATDWVPTLNIFYILEILVGLLGKRYTFQTLQDRGYYRALFMINTFLLININLSTQDVPPLVLHVIVNYYFQHPKHYQHESNLSQVKPITDSVRSKKHTLKTLPDNSFYEHVRICARRITLCQIGNIIKIKLNKIMVCNIDGKRIMKEWKKNNIEQFIRNDLQCKNVLFAMYISKQIKNQIEDDINQKRGEFAFENYSAKEFLIYVENVICRFPVDMFKTYGYNAKSYSEKNDQEIITFLRRHCQYNDKASMGLIKLIDNYK
eukprot:486838_1